MSIQVHIDAKDGIHLRKQIAAMLAAEAAPPAPLPDCGIVLPAAFGAELQGGFYAGPHFEDGKLVHLIGAPEALGDHKWEDAKTKASEYRGGGFEDWFLPDLDQLTVARIYAKAKFDKAYHWSATPFGLNSVWYVSFDYGYVYITFRRSEFRVRPFRRLSI